MVTGWKLENTYSELPATFYSRVVPKQVVLPTLVAFNGKLAATIGLDADALEAEIPQVFSGNALPIGAHPIAQAYSGHQYGHFTMLGDGRAILLGEQITPDGKRFDIQLKGSGQTPYSRRGDGRAALGPMLREYLISEAMFALGIPTTRSLAVVTTGEPVYRETQLPGGVLTRVAASHIRVGTFEYAATLGVDAVRSLADYTIGRHFKELLGTARPYEGLLREVISKQAKLIAAWMNVGFVHGVMNTDNMAISGETIDYGPCAFVDRYDPATVFSSIDRHGRYAYGNQPSIAFWNLTRFAETLLPLFGSDEEKAIEFATEVLSTFSSEFSMHWRKGMGNKLGLFETKPEDETLVDDLLTWMLKNKSDFTNTFRSLTSGTDIAQASPDLQPWFGRLKARRESEGHKAEEIRSLMQDSNPNLIPRNHQVEAALSAAVERADFSQFQKLLAALQFPFESRPEQLPFLDPSPSSDEPYRTFCGT